jgi:Spy/CpxP family protein refolding chaperone
MKAFRVVALGALLLAVGAISARAQSGATQQGQAGRRPSPLLDNMMLTDAQKSKIEGVTRKYQPEMQAIFESMNSGGDRASAMQKRTALFEKMQPEIRAVLTPDQQAIFDKNAAEMKARLEQMSRQ